MEKRALLALHAPLPRSLNDLLAKSRAISIPRTLDVCSLPYLQMDHELLVVANGLETGLRLCVAGELMRLDPSTLHSKLPP